MTRDELIDRLADHIAGLATRFEKLYDELLATRRALSDLHGTFDAQSARELMSRPVAMKSNQHSVLFETKSSRLWVANASSDGHAA